MRRLLILALCVPVFAFGFVSCFNQPEPQPMEGLGPIKPPAPTPTPPPKVYDYARPNLTFLGMEQLWERPLSDKDAPTVRDAYLLGDYYVIETSTLKLYGFNRKSGEPGFIISLEDPADVRCGEDDKFVFAAARDVLYSIDKLGFLGYKKGLKFAPASQLVSDEGENIYMGCYDGLVRAFLKTGRYVEWNFTTAGVVSARPVIGSRLLYAGSEDNNLYALSLENGSAQWQFKTLGPIRANPIYARTEHRVLVGSTDGSLYCLYDLPQGGTRESQMAWLMPYASGASIVKSPVLAAGIVYVINENHECHAVDLQTGRAKWVLKDVNSFVARGDHNVYLLRGTNSLLAVNPATGDVRWVLNTASLTVSRTLTNSVDGSIYLMRPDGATILLREHQPQAAPAPKAPESAPAAP